MASIEKKTYWRRALVCLAGIPLLPEYLCPVLVFLAFGFAAADAARAGRRWRVGTVGWLILLYTAYLFLGAFFSAHILNSLLDVLMWLAMFLAYLAVYNTVTDGARLDFALRAVSVALAVVGGLAAGQYLLAALFNTTSVLYFWLPLDQFVYYTLVRWFTGAPANLWLDIGQLRSAATFTNPNVMAEGVVLWLPFALYRAAHKGRVLLAGLAVGAVMFSGSRGGMLAVAAVGIVLVAGALLTRLPACGRLLKKARVWIMIGVGAAAALAAGVLPRLLTIASGDTSTAERLAAWRIALQEIARRPFFGSGAGMQNFWSILEANGLPQVPHAHNLYLQVLVTGGIVGLLLVFGLFAGVLFRQRGKTLTLALAFCAGVLVFGVVEYPFMCPKLVGAFLVALGLLACVRRVAATPADAPPAGQTAA